MGIMEKIFGDLNTKEVRKVEKIVDVIESYDAAMQALSDDELRAKTGEFKARLAEGGTLDDIYYLFDFSDFFCVKISEDLFH